MKWVEKEEASYQASPTCPFCRVAISENDVLAIMGRVFRRREAVLDHSNGEDEIDELILVKW